MILELRSNSNHRQTRTALLILIAAFALTPVACKRPPAPQAKRYHLVGTVISIDTAHGSANIDGQEVPGFMAAMAMPYPVHDSKALAALSPGDQITADIVVTDTDSYLENIVVTKKGTGPANTTGRTHLPQPGEKVPDFALINQDGKRIRLRSYQGDVLLVTFIYTRCPFPTFCPLVSRNFAQIYAHLRKDPAIGSKKIRLLSVSFDPKHDTPAVLKRYAESFKSTTGHNPFDRWEFAAVPAKELPKVANFFGLYYSVSGDQIVHSLSTSVISPDGTIYKWYDDNSWKPTDLLQDATQSLEQDNRRNAGPRNPASVPTA
ncbi:MAG TPA: SCO family protein [Candidatus Acidoferrales bacterium]